MAESRKDDTGDAAFEWLVEGQLSLFEGEYDICLTQLNAVGGGDGVNLMRVQAKGIKRSQKIARRRAG